METLLKAKNVNLSFNDKKVINDVSFEINSCERVGLVGESGCGKTLLSQLLLGFIPEGAKNDGDVFFRNQNVFELKGKDLRKLRGSGIGYTFQDPYTALDPVFRTGFQVAEALMDKEKASSKKEAVILATETMKNMGIKYPEILLDSYPFQLSGGMVQRLYIAMILMLQPELLIADEPVSSLDAVTQTCVVNMIKREVIARESALLFITHDLSMLPRIADRIIVMFNGYIVEDGPCEKVSGSPDHPYTRFLYNHNVKDIACEQSGESIDRNLPHCPFADFCIIAEDICRQKVPEVKQINDSRVRCHLC